MVTSDPEFNIHFKQKQKSESSDKRFNLENKTEMYQKRQKTEKFTFSFLLFSCWKQARHSVPRAVLWRRTGERLYL